MDTENIFEELVKELGDSDQSEIASALKNLEAIDVPKELLEEQGDEQASNDLLFLISSMTIPQKIKLALFGNMSARRVLIKDKNKMVPVFVLKNARITDGEIVEAAKNPNTDDRVLRTISGDSMLMKNYALKLAISMNPKVPVPVALRWIKFLADRDLRSLAGSKNISSVVANQCRKLLNKKAQH